MERRDCMKHWLISTNYKRRLVDNEFTRPAFILNAQACQSFPPTLFLRHLFGIWESIWEFAGFDMKNYAFQRIDLHNSSHQYSAPFQPAQQALGSSGRKRERTRARETRNLACLLLLRAFFLVPTTSKRLLRRLAPFKNCFNRSFEIFSKYKYFQEGFLKTFPFQYFDFLCGHSSKGSLYLSNGISAFSLYHFSQSLAISSSNMQLCIFFPIYFEFSSQHCLKTKTAQLPRPCLAWC